MNKKEIKVVAALAAFALLLAAVLFMMKSEENKEETVEYLVDIQAESIVSVDYANGSEYVHLKHDGECWRMADDGDFNVKQSAVAGLISAIRDTTVTGRINVKSQANLDEYSLLSPQCIIEFKTSQGDSRSIRIGTMSSLTENLYVSLDGDTGTVFITTAQMAQAFSSGKLDLLEYPDIPTPSSGQNAVTVKNIYGTVSLVNEGGEWYIETDEGRKPVDGKTAYNYYFLTWDMHWRGAVEHDARNLSRYDLTGPRISYTLDYTGDNGEKKIFELELGSSLPDGTCYAKLKDSNDIYLLDSLMADWLESTKTEDFYELQE